MNFYSLSELGKISEDFTQIIANNHRYLTKSQVFFTKSKWKIIADWSEFCHTPFFKHASICGTSPSSSWERFSSMVRLRKLLTGARYLQDQREEEMRSHPVGCSAVCSRKSPGRTAANQEVSPLWTGSGWPREGGTGCCCSRSPWLGEQGAWSPEIQLPWKPSGWRLLFWHTAQGMFVHFWKVLETDVFVQDFANYTILKVNYTYITYQTWTDGRVHRSVIIC